MFSVCVADVIIYGTRQNVERGGSPLVSFNHVIDLHFVTFLQHEWNNTLNTNPNPNPNPNPGVITDPQMCKLSPFRSAPLCILSCAIIYMEIRWQHTWTLRWCHTCSMTMTYLYCCCTGWCSWCWSEPCHWGRFAPAECHRRSAGCCSSSVCISFLLLFLFRLLNKGELVQSFCGRMPILSPTSRNRSLDLIFSLTTYYSQTEEGASLPLRRIFVASRIVLRMTWKVWACPKRICIIIITIRWHARRA